MDRVRSGAAAAADGDPDDALRIFAACDRYGRSLARSSEQYEDPVGSLELASAFTSAAAQTRGNIDVLVATIDGTNGARIKSATDELDAAETRAPHEDGEGEPRPDTRRFLIAVHALRQIERAIVTAATNLGTRRPASTEPAYYSPGKHAGK